jgi:nucleoside-diphosphate-sugar epimerase
VRASIERDGERDGGGVRVVAHVRPDSSRLDEWRQRFGELGAEVDTTVWELGAMTETMARLLPTHVFALLGTTQKRARGAGMDARQAYESIDYGLTRLLLDAVVAAGLRPRFVYLSSAGVSESSRSPYMQARVRAEAAIRESGVPYTIARPSFITGADRDDSRPMERVGAAVVDGLLAGASLLGGKRLRQRYASTSNAVLARSLVRLAWDGEARDRVIEGAALRQPGRP